MNLPFFIARRYLFARKSRSVINVISGITIAGIALASMAMICTLSVFNGFHSLMESLFTDFDPDLKVVSARGKVFDQISDMPGRMDSLHCVSAVTCSLEEQAMIRYGTSQCIVTVKGVEDNVCDVYGLDKTLRGSGEFILKDNVCDYAVLGIGVMTSLNCGFQPAYPYTIYAPKRGVRVNMSNPTANFNSADVFSPGLIFQVNQQPYDDTYIIVSMEMARRLFGYEHEVSSMDIRLSDGYSVRRAKKEIQEMLGDGFVVQDRYEQQADVFKVVKLEKLVSYLFLTFILLIACFNIIGSLIMLMVEKEDDTAILGSMGLSGDSTSRIFVYEGLLISAVGALAGLIVGVTVALLQQHLKFIPLGANGNFIVDYYPVCVKLSDVTAVMVTVMLVTLLSVWPVRRIADRFIKSKGESEY